jgi:hypothetical protein
VNQFQSSEENNVSFAGGNSEPVSEARDVGFVGRLFGMLHAPGSSFAVINGKWDWLLVTLLFVAVGFGAMQLQKPYLLPDLKQATLTNIESVREQVGEEKYQEIREQIETGMEENFALTPKTLLIGFVASIIFTALIGLICWGSGNFMFGGKAKFWQVLAIVAFAGIISLVHGYTRAGLMAMNGTSYVYLGLGLLKPEPDASFVFYLLRQLEFITMWKIAAMSIALGSLYNIKAAKFAYVLVPIWLLFVAAVAGANLFAGGSIVY